RNLVALAAFQHEQINRQHDHDDREKTRPQPDIAYGCRTRNFHHLPHLSAKVANKNGLVRRTQAVFLNSLIGDWRPPDFANHQISRTNNPALRQGLARNISETTMTQQLAVSRFAW